VESEVKTILLDSAKFAPAEHFFKIQHFASATPAGDIMYFETIYGILTSMIKACAYRLTNINGMMTHQTLHITALCNQSISGG